MNIHNLKSAGVAMLGALAVVTAQGVEMNETLKTIMNRKSVRQYKPEAISNDTLEWLVRAGMAAPTAVDKRPWDFIIVTDKALLKKLAEALPYAKMAEHAAAAILVVGDINRQWGGPSATYWVMDCSAATENILLAAESLGLGAVWTAVYPEADRIAAVRAIFPLPDHAIPLNLIPIGVPAGEVPPKDKYQAERIHWNEWQAQPK